MPALRSSDVNRGIPTTPAPAGGYADLLWQLPVPVLWLGADAAGELRVRALNPVAERWCAQWGVAWSSMPLARWAAPPWISELRRRVDQALGRAVALPVDAPRPPVMEVARVQDPRWGDGVVCVLQLPQLGTEQAAPAHILLQSILDHHVDCVKLVRADGHVLQMNRAGLRMLGMPDVEAVNERGLLSFGHPEDLGTWQRFHQRVCAGVAGDLQYRVLCAEGMLRWLHCTSVPLTDPRTGEVHQLALTRDLSAQREAEQALQASRMHTRQVLDAAGIGDWELDADSGRVARAAQHDLCFGYSTPREHWTAQDWLDRTHLDDRPRMQRVWERVSAGMSELDHEFQVVWPDSSRHWVWMRATPRCDDTGRVIALQGIVADITTRKRAERLAQEADGRLAELLALQGDGVWEWDARRERWSGTARLAQLLGTGEAQESPMQADWTCRLHPDESSKVLEWLEHTRDPATTLEHRLRAADGNWRWVQNRVLSVQCDPHGEVQRRVGALTDIDARKRQALDLQHLHERLRMAVEGAGFGVWEHRLSDDQLICDEQMYRLFGVPDDGSVQFVDVWRACALSDDRPQLERYVAGLLGGEEHGAFEFRIRRANDGAERRIEAHAHVQRDAEGQPVNLVGISRDITDGWWARQLNRLLGTSLSMLHDMVLIKERTTATRPGDVVYANDTFKRRMGYTEADFGQMLDQLRGRAELDATHRALFGYARAESKPVRMDIRIHNRDGEPIWLQLDVVPVPDETGDITHWVLIGHDITEQRAAEDALQRMNAELELRVAQRTAELDASNQELRTFAYSVSHDLFAPLRGLEHWLAALQEEWPPQAGASALVYRDRIGVEVRRLGDRLSGLLRLARLGQSELVLSDLDITLLAETSAEELRRRDPQRALHFDIQSGMRLHADHALCALVIGNLLENAWKYTRDRDPAEIRVWLTADDTLACLHVLDNGVGFDPAHAHDLFQPFRRLHPPSQFPGTGIGLAVVDRVMRRHGGWIEAQGNPGVGASFHVYWPR